MISRILGSVLQVAGVVLASVSAGFVWLPAGGFVLAAGLIVFGLSLENQGE